MKRDLKQYGSDDELQLAIRNYLDTKLDSLVDMRLDFSGNDYLVIEVPAQRQWVYVDNEFVVRRGNLSKTLKGRDGLNYRNTHRRA